MTVSGRIDNMRVIRSPHGTELSAKSWLTEAPMRMLMNNLDPDVAERPGTVMGFLSQVRYGFSSAILARIASRTRLSVARVAAARFSSIGVGQFSGAGRSGSCI